MWEWPRSEPMQCTQWLNDIQGSLEAAMNESRPLRRAVRPCAPLLRFFLSDVRTGHEPTPRSPAGTICHRSVDLSRRATQRLLAQGDAPDAAWHRTVIAHPRPRTAGVHPSRSRAEPKRRCFETRPSASPFRDEEADRHALCARHARGASARSDSRRLLHSDPERSTRKA